MRHRLVILAVALGAACGATQLSAADPPEEFLAGEHSASPLELRESWRYRVGDDPAWSRPAFDDSGWTRTALPVGWDPPIGEADFVWYRGQFPVSRIAEQANGIPLGLRMGPVNSAYEIFVGGERLGGVGTIATDASESELDYDTRGLFAIPPRAIASDGSLPIAIRVWRDPRTLTSAGGPFEGVPEIAPFDTLARREMITRVAGLVLALFFSFLGLFHLELHRRTRRERSFLWLGGLALGLGLYTFLRTPWKSSFGLGFEEAKELEHVVAFLLIPAFIQFVWKLLKEPISRPVRIYQWANVGAAALASLPGMRLNFHVLPFWQVAMLIALGAGAVKVTRHAILGLTEARIMLPGYLLVSLAILNDVLVDRGLYEFPRIAPLGFAALLSSFAASVADRILRSDRDLEEMRVGLERRVEERTAELVAANEAKSRFLATMSHEIRTPLNAVLGTHRILLERSLGPKERELCEGAERSGQVLLSLIDDVLDFTRIESGHLELVNEPFDLEMVCEEAFEILADRAAEKGIDFSLLIDATLPRTLFGDAVRMRQILVNLMNNAIKFTRAGWVLVDVSRNPGGPEHWVRFRVTDTGVGIEPENLEVIFERFRQIDSSNSRRFAGAGLGLAICKALAQRMGGSISVSSRPTVGSVFECLLPLPPGRGSQPTQPTWGVGRTVRFVDLPLASQRALGRALESAGAEVQLGGVRSADGQPRTPCDVEIVSALGRVGAARAAEGRSRDAAVRILLESENGSRRSPRAGEGDRDFRLPHPVRPSALRRLLCELWGVRSPGLSRSRSGTTPEHVLERATLRVLVADDDEMGRRISTAMLQNLGVQPIAASDGLEALRLIESGDFDLVFLDLQMPGLEGVEVARRARAALGDHCPRLVALSANVVPSDRQACEAAGIEAFVAKPVRPEELLAVLRDFEEFRRSIVRLASESSGGRPANA